MSWLQGAFTFCGLELLLQIGIRMLYIRHLPYIMHHNPTEPNKHVMVAGCFRFLWTCVVAADRHLHAAAMHNAPQPN